MADLRGPADRIHIEQLELYARVGVTDNERSRPQRITLNVTVWPKRQFDKLEDDISLTVNYAEISRAARDLVQNQPASLIETLAAAIGDDLLKHFPIAVVEIELRKYVLPDAAHVAVVIRREACKDHA